MNFNDEDLIQLMQTFHDDPIFFSKVILDIIPDEQQRKVILALYEKKRATVRSGRGCGKTWAAGIVAWHFLCTRAFSQIYITAPSGGTITGALWPTLGKMYDRMNPIYRDQFEFQTGKVKHKEYPHTWFCITRTARHETPDALAGSHAKNMLYIIDEASGMSDAMFRVIYGSLTEEANYLLMLSNPRRLSGFFYDSHKITNRDTFAQLHMSAINSAWVTDQSIQDWKDLYGEDSNIYKVEVLGEFPDAEEESIIPFETVVRASETTGVEPAGEMRWGLDVGQGNDKSVLIKRQGPLVYPDIKKWKFRDTMRVVGEVVKEYNETPDELKPDKIYVDAIGIGKGSYDRLKEQGLPVHPAIASKKANRRKYIYNQKSEWWKEMSNWFKDEVQIPNDAELIEQIAGMRAVPSSDGRFKTEGKDKFRKRYGYSPDTADALAHTFCLKSKMQVGIIT